MTALSIISDTHVINKIFEIRGYKVMLDSDLAELYTVETKRINEQIKRNRDRFPEDFMFQLTQPEWDNLKSQIATSSWGGRRNLYNLHSQTHTKMAFRGRNKYFRSAIGY